MRTRAPGFGGMRERALVRRPRLSLPHIYIYVFLFILLFRIMWFDLVFYSVILFCSVTILVWLACWAARGRALFSHVRAMHVRLVRHKK